jgi:cell wall-associated NlpC family hydrolase
MTSGSPQEVLDKLNTLDQISTNKNLVLVQYAKAQQQAKTAKGSADAASAAAAKTIKGIAAKKTKIEAGLVTLKVKLSALTAAQRAQVMAAAGGAAVSSASASSTSTSTSTSASSAPGSSAPASTPAPQTAPTVTGAPSAAAQAAVNAALSRLGSPYVWAAAGPSSFDCSGLTMWSYAQAGVGLPHSSSAQRGAGPSVAFGSLLPGDLVFMPGHVGMYIGNGQVVHAPTTGDVVKIIQFSSMGWDYANRPTG